MNELTHSQKQYLLIIYKLGQNGEDVKSADVAKALGVSKASTASMTAKLCNIGYIEKESYGHISLTENGAKAANSIFTSHLIIMDFLMNFVGLDEKSAYSDAVKIVINVSENTLNKLEEYIFKR